ncbi:MAG: orotidine-5'-phosphate decarboxylase [Cyanobacteria bacterium P01_D01_bin.123]
MTAEPPPTSVLTVRPARERIIVAADVSSLEEAIALVEAIPQVQWWKVGLELFTATGPIILDELKDRQKNVFLDLKLHDIPNTVGRAAAVVARYGVDLLSVHAMGGGTMLTAAAEAIAGTRCQLLAISVLTSHSGRQLARELHVSLELSDYALQLALLAREAGCAGAVCSGEEAASLRRVCGPDFVLVTPGIRPSGTASDDQRRILTPAAARRAGANFLVVGRPVTQAPDPAAAFAAMCYELNTYEGR